MRPTEILGEEHRVIEQMLDCLEKLAEDAVAKSRLDVQGAADAVEFFQVFADRCHHGKEEELLFPLLEKRGFSREGGPTAVMRSEHETGRAQVRAMGEAVEAARRNDSSAAPRFVRDARAYVWHLREHIQKEDHCLFPMAGNLLTPEDEAGLVEAFRGVESGKMGAGTHDRYLALARNLAARLGVAHAAGPARSGGCCGHA